MRSATVSAEEVARFDALAAKWWDPNGPMQPLHRMNPARIGWIEERIRRSYPPTAAPRILDVGCGAGLAAEALARLGFTVLGLDAAGEAIEAARVHAQGQDGLAVSYQTGVAEDLASEGLRFDVVTALEVVEHVPDPAAFVRVLRTLVEPGGLLFMSTLNRTSRAWVTAKFGAEYVLRWLPVGTHDYSKFLTPTELAAILRGAGFRVTATAGLSFDLVRQRWHTGRDLSVNYLVQATA